MKNCKLAFENKIFRGKETFLKKLISIIEMQMKLSIIMKYAVDAAIKFPIKSI